MQKIICKKPVKTDFPGKIVFSSCRTLSENVLYFGDLSCKPFLLPSATKKQPCGPARVFILGPEHPGSTTEPSGIIGEPGTAGNAGHSLDGHSTPRKFVLHTEILSCIYILSCS